MTADEGGSRLDGEVRELLGDDPELLALAETIASLRPAELGLPEPEPPSARARLRRAGRALLVVARRLMPGPDEARLR